MTAHRCPSPNLDKAADFLWLNGRLLDRRRFAFHFGERPGEGVLTALAAYQNGDGGFGNALEPDIRSPRSQTQPVEIACRVLDEIGALDHPMLKRACDWLETVSVDGAVPFVLASAKDYPASPWWHADEPTPPSLNPTAAIAGYLAGHIQHPWVDGALAWCRAALPNHDPKGIYDVLPVLVLLERTGTEEEQECFLDLVRERRLAEFEMAPMVTSLGRRMFSDVEIESHLEALVAEQQDDGGWPITWDPPSPTAASEWRGYVTVLRLLTLRSYGRL